MQATKHGSFTGGALRMSVVACCVAGWMPPPDAGSVDLQDCDVFPSSTHPCAFEIVTPEEHRRAGPQRDQFHYMYGL